MNSYIGPFDYVLITLVLSSNLFLGLLVLTKNKKNVANQLFALLALSVIIWNASAFISELVSGYDAKLILSKVAYLFALVTVSLASIFTLKFLSFKKQKIFLYLDSALTAFMTVSILFTNLVVSSLTLREVSFDINMGALGLFYTLITIFMVAQLVIIPVAVYRKSVGTKRQQIKYLFVGFISYALLNILFNVGLKDILNSDQFYRYGNYSVLLLVIFMSYALVRHRLMDIRAVVARSVAYTLLLVTLAGGYALAIFGAQTYLFPGAGYSSAQIAVQVTLAIVMAFTFQPLRRFMTRITDKIFFKNDYVFEDLVKELTDAANRTLILIELLYKTVDILIKKMKVTRGMFILLDEHGAVYTMQSLQYQKIVKYTAAEVLALSKRGVVAFDELEEGSRTKALLRRFDASLSLSIASEEGKPIGVLLLGEKESGDMYSAKDITLFEILMPELSLAIHRAKEHEKVQQFNVTLQAEVARKTKELQEANDHLQELDKAKDEFISMASHQLRTPLTAIKGYLSMLLEGDAGEIKMAQYDFVNEAFSAASRMVGLINDLLNVSRMETGRFFLEPVKVDMEILTKEEIKQIQNHADEKKLYVKLEVKNKNLPKIYADETKIRQVVMNFVDNAIYYTQKGGVTVSLDADKKNFIFKVVDTGIGVPEAQKKNLFEKFYRADNARRTRPDGTGLGIYLAKRVVEDHGGMVTFESVEGKGSTFGFLFPLKSKIKKELTIAPPDLATAVQINPESQMEAPKDASQVVEKKESVSTDASLDESKRASQGGEDSVVEVAEKEAAPVVAAKKKKPVKKQKPVEPVEEKSKNPALF